MTGYSVGPPGGENYGQPLFLSPEGGPGIELVQWSPEYGQQAHIVTEWHPGAKTVMFENGPPPGYGPDYGPPPGAIAAMMARQATQATAAGVDMTPIHMLLL
jgi:hypothetical protein